MSLAYSATISNKEPASRAAFLGVARSPTISSPRREKKARNRQRHHDGERRRGRVSLVLFGWGKEWIVVMDSDFLIFV